MRRLPSSAASVGGETNLTDTRVVGDFKFEAGLVAMAERELAAFAAAVDNLFGSEHALQSAEDWIEELALKRLNGETIPDFRQITIAASARLAARV
jgi:hypothetical protein